MKHLISIQYQSVSEGERPIDEALNRETITTDNMGNIPSVGDFVCFDNKDEIEVVYMVKSRLFDYKYIDKDGNWAVSVNVLVSRLAEGTYNRLVRH
jgi:hypothetical protein